MLVSILELPISTWIKRKRYRDSRNVKDVELFELISGYIINGEKWFNAEARAMYDKIVENIGEYRASESAERALGACHAFMNHARRLGYSEKVQRVYWTENEQTIPAYLKDEIDLAQHPIDLVVKFQAGPADGYLGYANSMKPVMSRFMRKGVRFGDIWSFLKSRPNVNDTEGIRDFLMARLLKSKPKFIHQFVEKFWIDGKVPFPPYCMAESAGVSKPFTVRVIDPVRDRKIRMFQDRRFMLREEGSRRIILTDHKGKGILVMTVDMKKQELMGEKAR